MQSNAAILRKIAEVKPRRVILFAVWRSYTDYALGDERNGGLGTTLTALKKIVRDVIVVGQAPYWSPNLPTQVYNFWRSNGRLPDRLPPDTTQYRKIDDTLAALSATAQARFISAFNALCNEDGCLTHTPRSRAELLSWDNGHLTVAGARFLATLLQLD